MLISFFTQNYDSMSIFCNGEKVWVGTAIIGGKGMTGHNRLDKGQTG